MTTPLLLLWLLVLAVLSGGLVYEVRYLGRGDLSARARRESAIRASVYAAALILTGATLGLMSASILL